MSGSFSDEINAALAAPLAREHVKGREQGGRKVSYIEGWHAIAEANRIFGFDGWTRETVMCECCHDGEYQKAVWENGRRTNKTVTSYRCSYRARVRVTVGQIVREGTGHGHGFADNPGEAHESAEKEAETDAMKRALMTFGNPFGLALYDKAQTEVEPIQGQRRAAPPAGERNAAPPSEPAPNGNASVSEFWARDNYRIDPEVIQGGLPAWDGEFLRAAKHAPNIDALLKLKADNKPHHATWYKKAAGPVRENFATKIAAIESNLLARPA